VVRIVGENMTLDIIVPLKNEEAVLPLFYNEIIKQADVIKKEFKLGCEFIFVNDGSTDGSLGVLKNLQKKDKRVHYIDFSRNFGKEAALFAGLEYSKGDFVIVMDVDLQDPPELICEMYKTLVEKNIDCVATRRVSRKGEPVIRSFFARRFYGLINGISDVKIVDGARDFRIMTRRMVDAILTLCEKNRFSKGIFVWVGFDTHYLEYENINRAAGETKWSFFSLLKYSIEGILGFSTFPLVIATYAGILMCVFSFLAAIFYVVKTLLEGETVQGFPTLIFFITFFGGLQMLGIGILSSYMSKTYLEVKNRPIYIAKEKN
jgi:glycosyltransferase involved in cell wall biosynthesis